MSLLPEEQHAECQTDGSAGKMGNQVYARVAVAGNLAVDIPADVPDGEYPCRDGEPAKEDE